MMETVSRSRQVGFWLSISVMILYVVLFEVHTVKCQSFPYGQDIFGEKMLPFCVELPGALRSGNIIKITGIFENSLSLRPNTRLNVILRSRCLSSESPFQLSVKFNYKTVTRNSFQNGDWGEEETDGPFPFSLGAQFVLQIEVQPDGYVVKGNDVPLWTFEHRFSFRDVKYLEVTGDQVFIPKIESVDPDVKGQQHSQLVYPVPLTKPILYPTSPFWGQFPEEVQAGKAIRVKGYFPTEPNRVSINLCADCFQGPVMLHLDIRFKFYNDFHRVLRCYYQNGSWLIHETSGPFPFSVGEPFELVIQITPQSYNISVNNKHYWTYTHHVPYAEISSIRIVKNMNIWKVEYIDFPEKEKRFPPMLTEGSDLNKFSREPHLNKSSSAASVYNIVYTIHALHLFLFLKAM